MVGVLLSGLLSEETEEVMRRESRSQHPVMRMFNGAGWATAWTLRKLPVIMGALVLAALVVLWYITDTSQVDQALSAFFGR